MTDEMSSAGMCSTQYTKHVYKQKQSPQRPGVRVAVFAYSSTRNSVVRRSADYSLDVVGLDTAAPNVVSAFARGEFS